MFEVVVAVCSVASGRARLQARTGRPPERYQQALFPDSSVVKMRQNVPSGGAASFLYPKPPTTDKPDKSVSALLEVIEITHRGVDYRMSELRGHASKRNSRDFEVREIVLE